MVQSATAVTGPWADVVGAASPQWVAAGDEQVFYRLRGVSACHSGVGAGCPQQGYDFTGLPDDHWANSLATPTTWGWIVPQKLTGFADEGGADPFVRVVLRSFSVSNNWAWWTGTYDTWEDDAIHQNEGWFHFRVRNPNPLGALQEYRLRFELCFDNPYAFASDPLQLNYWWMERTWDWEAHGERRVYTPIYRLKSSRGKVGLWQHIAETNAHPVAGCTNDQRHYRCRFDQVIPRTDWTEIEVAQNLPYSLEDRDAFLRWIQTNYPPKHQDLCIRRRHLGYGGLFAALEPESPDVEFNELYAIELFKQVSGSAGDPDLATKRIVIILAGLDYEPAGNFVAEGVLLEILDRWGAAEYDYRNRASYVVIPIANPDAYEWGTCHVIPYGNGCEDNALHRGYVFLDPGGPVPDDALDPEALALRDYFRLLTAQGLDGKGGSVVALLDFQNDLCPSPIRWTNGPGMFPPIYGGFGFSDLAQSNAAVRFLENLRRELPHPNTGRYVRDPASPQGWWKYSYSDYGIPLWITFEFDAAVVYSHFPGVPGGWQGAFTDAIQLPGSGGGPTFYVHGYIDQIGQATAPDGDPAHVFKLFGRDIIDAARQELLTP